MPWIFSDGDPASPVSGPTSTELLAAAEVDVDPEQVVVDVDDERDLGAGWRGECDQ